MAVLPRPWSPYRATRSARVPDVAITDEQAAALAADPAVVTQVAAATHASPGWVRSHVRAHRSNTTLRVQATAGSAATARATAAAALQAMLARLQSQWQAEQARRTDLSHQAYADALAARDALTLWQATTHPCVGDVSTLVACAQINPTDIDGGRTVARLRTEIATTRARSQQIDTTVAEATFVVSALGNAAIVDDSVDSHRLRLTEPLPALFAGLALLGALAVLMGHPASRPAWTRRHSRRVSAARRAPGPGESVQHIDLRAAEERARIEAAREADLAAARIRERREHDRRVREELAQPAAASLVMQASSISWSPTRAPAAAPPSPPTPAPPEPAVPAPAPAPAPAPTRPPVVRVTLAQAGAPKPDVSMDVPPKKSGRPAPLVGRGHTEPKPDAS